MNVTFDFFLEWQNGPMGLRGGVNTLNYIDLGKNFVPNVWTHYAVVRKGGVFTIYENGINIGSTSSHTTDNVDLSNLSIGGNNAVGYTAYKGYMDDFAIYDYAKYDGDFAPPTDAQTDANLVHLDFEELFLPITQEPIKEVVSDTHFDILGNAFLEGKNDKYKFGGSSLYFPGTDSQRINIKNANLNFGTKDFTVSFWMNPETTQPKSHPLAFGGDTNGTFDFFVEWNNGSMGLRGGNTSTINYINLGKNFTPNVWTHYAVVRKDGEFIIYENGINVGSTTSFTTVNVDLSNLSIGGNNATGYTPYKGYMDDFAIYNYAKYEDDFIPPTVTADVDPANEDSNDSLKIKDDVTGNDFTILGGANIVGTDTQKKFGNASLYFPGRKGQRINIQNENLNFGTNDFTVSFWANPETPQLQDYPLFFGGDVNTTFDFFLEWNNGSMGLRGGKINQLNYINLGKNFTPNVWTHYAVIRKDGVFTIYENGINIGSTSAFLTQNIDLSNLSIGGNNSITNTAYKGYIDDFIIYDYVVWDSDFTPPTAVGRP